MNTLTQDTAADRVDDRALSQRLIARVIERMPDRISDLVSSFALDCDFDMLEVLLANADRIPAAEPDDRLDWLASTFPLMEFATDKARAKRFVHDWAQALGFDTDEASLSKLLVGVKSIPKVEGLLAMGADPNYPIDEGGRYLTPLGKAFDRSYSAVIPAMLDSVLRKGELPLHSFGADPCGGAPGETTPLFEKVLSGLRGIRVDTEECVVAYLSKNEVPDSWKRAVGAAFAARQGDLGVSRHVDGFRLLINLLLVAQFEDPSQWKVALSGLGYMDALVSNGGNFYQLGKIVQAAAQGGVDINSWSGNWRHNGADYPLPLLIFAAKYGQANTVQRFLELGAETEFRMPGDNDTPGAPYTGPSLTEYAHEGGVRAPVQQVLAAWRAQHAIQRITGTNTRSNGSAP